MVAAREIVRALVHRQGLVASLAVPRLHGQDVHLELLRPVAKRANIRISLRLRPSAYSPLNQ